MLGIVPFRQCRDHHRRRLRTTRKLGPEGLQLLFFHRPADPAIGEASAWNRQILKKADASLKAFEMATFVVAESL